MGREPMRRRERREAHFRVRHEGMAERAPLPNSAARAYFSGIDKHDSNQFGIRSCVKIELNQLFEPPSHTWCRGEKCCIPWRAVGERVTFISYAAW
eukprot:scaffold78141_cov32-Tisochrysis_lutea.AAC.6